MTEDENYDEEIEEEGTDYNLTYFDNGEDYLAGEEDALEDNEGPYYWSLSKFVSSPMIHCALFVENL